MYIKNLKITRKERCFSKSKGFELKNITLLVGDQGCGKSTLLEGIQNHANFLEVELTNLGHAGVDTFYFDTEKMNPRTRSPEMYTKASGENLGIGYASALTSRFKSHGEVLKLFIIDCLKKAENCVVLLDEPESALSLRNQYELTKQVHAAVDRKCQIIIATHCLPLIQSVETVLSLEHKKWMQSKKFIESQAEK